MKLMDTEGIEAKLRCTTFDLNKRESSTDEGDNNDDTCTYMSCYIF